MAYICATVRGNFHVSVASNLLVQVFKTLTQLLPFMGIQFGRGILWLVGDLIHGAKKYEDKVHFTIGRTLSRIDMMSVVFFIGLVSAVVAVLGLEKFNFYGHMENIIGLAWPCLAILAVPSGTSLKCACLGVNR